MTTAGNAKGGGASGGAAAILELLKKVPMFQFLSPQELGAVASRMRLATYKPGDMIFNKDESGDTLQIIAAGAVKIYLPSAGGEEAPLAMLHPGDFFGELALMDGDVRSASAMALARTAILTLQRDEFLEFITTNPKGTAAVFRSLTSLIRRQNAQLYGEFFGS